MTLTLEMSRCAAHNKTVLPGNTVQVLPHCSSKASCAAVSGFCTAYGYPDECCQGAVNVREQVFASRGSGMKLESLVCYVALRSPLWMQGLQPNPRAGW